MECRDCHVEFVPYHGKPGYINQCEDCATDVPKLGGNMIWDHKTAPYIEVKPMAEAVQFAKLTNRSSASAPLRSIVTSKSNGDQDREAGKQGSGAEDHATYNSRLGEKRTVKL